MPVIQLARRVPQDLMEPLKQEHNRIEQAGIITRMMTLELGTPTSFSQKEKRQFEGIYVPEKGVNECLKREHFEMLRGKDIEAELANARALPGR